jgi:hypothetical protein
LHDNKDELKVFYVKIITNRAPAVTTLLTTDNTKMYVADEELRHLFQQAAKNTSGCDNTNITPNALSYYKIT